MRIVIDIKCEHCQMKQSSVSSGNYMCTQRECEKYVTEYCHMLCRWIVSSQWQHILQKGPLRTSEDRSLSLQSSLDFRGKFQLKPIKEWEHLALLWTIKSLYFISHYDISYHNKRKTKYDPKRAICIYNRMSLTLPLTALLLWSHEVPYESTL